MDNVETIGIVGGVGPFAGLDLQRKILEETAVSRDQDHLPLISVSQPGPIPDRTEYLEGEAATNPAFPLAAQLLTLEQAGAAIAAIPCNTAHAPPIWDVIRAQLAAAGSALILLHMMEEVARFLQRVHPAVSAVGVLSTTGTYRAALYPAALEPAGFTVLTPTETMQSEMVHPAIYDPAYGLKALGVAAPRARADLLAGAVALGDAGAEAIILGCTEIPLALSETAVNGLPLIDATRVLARALVARVDEGRLRPLQ